MKSVVAFMLMLTVAVSSGCSSVQAGRFCRSCQPALYKNVSKVKQKKVSRRSNKCRTVNSCRTSTSNCSDGKCTVPTSTKTIERTRTVTKGNFQARMQAFAEEECRLQMKHGMGHRQPFPVGARFVGVGLNGSTCMTCGIPVAEAHIGGYSCRVW